MSTPEEYMKFVLSVWSIPPARPVSYHLSHGMEGLIEELQEAQDVLGCIPEVSDLNYALRWYEALGEARAKLLKELGDCYFYLAACRHYLGLKTEFSHSYGAPANDIDKRLAVAKSEACRLLSLTKKREFYQKPWTTEHQQIAEQRLGAVLIQLQSVSMGILGRDGVDMIIQLNVEKLKARYPDGKFSLEAAVAKKDEAKPRLDPDKMNGAGDQLGDGVSPWSASDFPSDQK